MLAHPTAAGRLFSRVSLAGDAGCVTEVTEAQSAGRGHGPHIASRYTPARLEAESHVLTIDVGEVDGVDLLTLRGELDFASGGSLSSAFADLTSGPRRVVVDLAGLDFVDSSGVKMLIAAARAVEDEGGEFVLAAPTETVRRVFEILHLADVVTVAETRQTALDVMAKSETAEARREADG